MFHLISLSQDQKKVKSVFLAFFWHISIPHSKNTVVAVLSLAVLKKRDSKDVQAQAANPSYMNENGGEYIAAFLKGTTDSTITVDIAEFITDGDTERIKELNLSEEDMPDGYYIYNPDEETVTWKLDGQTIYTFIDWNGDFAGSDYPEEYTTTDAEVYWNI